MTLAVTNGDLATYLGSDVDADRADMLIGLAMDLVTAIIDPPPDQAKAVVLTAAGRAYTNPTGETQELIGPYQVSRPAAGVYLTKAERASLRLLAGGSRAFGIDLLGAGYPDARFPTT